MPKKIHDRKTYFTNLEPTNHKKTFIDFLRWRLQGDKGKWPQWVEYPPQPLPEARVSDTSIRLTYINHATVLIQVAGLNILTDPIWSQRCSPIKGIGPKRVHAPGVALEQLPLIDAILLSHDHYDHLDLPTLKRLQQRFQAEIYHGLGVGDYLRSKKISGSCQDLAWWDRVELAAGLKLTFVPARHWSARSPFKSNTTLWGGFVLEHAQHSIYFAGDTAFGQHFALIKEKFPKLTVALLPIGAYEPRWFMQDAHMNPAEAVKAYQVLAPQYALGIHFNTFARLTDEAYDQPLHDLKHALQQAEISPNAFRTLLPGACWVI